jgi:uncharacterized membrane protein HdeD (DUF308 family)
MLNALADRWWLLLLRGISAIVFGILAISWPGLTLLTLIMLFGLAALINGVASIAVGLTGGTESYRWWELILVGVIWMIAGIATFVLPGMTAMALLYVIAFTAIAGGAAEVLAAIRLRKEIDNEWLLALAGVVAIFFGVFLLARPGEGALAVVLTIGMFLIAHGVIVIALSLRLRSLKQLA